MFSRFEWGEYLSWSYSPEFRVFMDGRIEIFPDEVWHQYADVTCRAGGLGEDLDDYHVDALVLDSDYHARPACWPRWNVAPLAQAIQCPQCFLFVRTAQLKSPNHFHLDVAEFSRRG